MKPWPVLCLLLVACASGGPAPDEDPLADFRVGTSRAGMFTAAWRSHPAPLPVNEPFELEVRLFEGGADGPPLSGAELIVDAWMPEHFHGMLRRPRATEVAPGRYRVRGMLLHMGGRWQVFVDVIRDGVAERAEFELVLE